MLARLGTRSGAAQGTEPLKITAELLPKQDYADEWIHMPFGGIKIISRDEDQPPAWLKVWARH